MANPPPFTCLNVTPQGLNAAAVDWVRRWGVGVLVPYRTRRAEPEFTEYIKTKNNTVPWWEDGCCFGGIGVGVGVGVGRGWAVGLGGGVALN